MMICNSSRTLARFLRIAAWVVLLASPSFAATSVSQFGITWTFDRDYPTGRFANGEYWVLGPVKIVSISPRSTTSGSRTINGSMINPAIGKLQGYDSACYGSNGSAYSSSLNVALGVSSSRPLTVAAGSSLISTISHSTAGQRPQLRSAAILTVLSKAPPSGSFRPPYVGTDKTVRWNKSQLNYSILRSLPKVANTPDLATVEAEFERPWMEQYTDWQGGYLHPTDNQPHYGRDMANALATGLLSLHLDYSKAQKEKLYIRLVQYGIDVYGAARNGAIWVDDGGHNHGRKMPLLLAGMALGDTNILPWADAARHFIFQEDRQTWYVNNLDVGRILYSLDGRPRVPYSWSHVGLAEWGEKHTQYPPRDGSNWDAYYRSIVGHSILGHALAARLLKAESRWNWSPFFDYADRYWAKEKGATPGWGNYIRPFVHAMWSAYRNSTPSNFTPDTTATESWTSSSLTAQTGSFTVAWDSVPSKAYMDGLTGLSLGAPSRPEDLATIVRYMPDGTIRVRNGSSYSAATTVKYSAGVSYRFVKTVNLATRRYSVTVTPKGGSTVQLARDFAFRSDQSTVTKLDHVGFCALAGAHSVSNINLQAASAPSTSVGSGMTAGSSSWTSTGFSAQTGNFSLTFDVTPSASNLTAEVGTSLGTADEVTDLATLIRFTSSGLIQARNSGLYIAANTLTYRAGVTYRVAMDINVETGRYDVTVTPAGGKAVTLGTNYAFRNTQRYATRLDRLSATATGGTVKVANVSLNGATTGTSSSGSTSTTSGLVASNGGWAHSQVSSQTGKFTVAFDVVPSANGLSAEIGTSLGAANEVTDLATLVRFTSSGLIQARNSGLYMAQVPMSYRAGTRYRVVMTVDVGAKRYDMTVTPSGQSTVTLASNYAFRNTQKYTSKLDRLSATATGGSVTVSNVVLNGQATSTASATTTTSTSDLTVNAEDWSSAALTSQTGEFRLSFDFVASTSGLNAEVGTSLGAADEVTDLATLVRLTSGGLIQARNSGLYMAANSLSYRAGTTYRVVMDVDVADRRYDMTVTPAGGKTVTIASNYAFRNTQKYTSKLDRLSATTQNGRVTVSNIRLH